jgi:seryl-tRNA synthetase
MKKLGILMIIMSGLFMYPFSCTAQIDEGCDTIVIEDPQQEAKISELESEISTALDQNDKLVKDLQRQGLIISTQSNEITSLKGQVSNQADQIQSLTVTNSVTQASLTKANSDIQILKSEVKLLEDELSLAPDTIYVDKPVQNDYIVVGGVEYKVDEIEQILPFQTVDTVDVSWCTEDPTKRQYFHEGDIDVYPHFINFATKEKGMIKVYFEEPLDTLIKKRSTLTLKRIRSHKEGLSQYNYISSK